MRANVHSIRRRLMQVAASLILLFFLAAAMVAFSDQVRLLQRLASGGAPLLSSETALYLMGYENPYFRQPVSPAEPAFSPTKTALELLTGMTPDKPRSLLESEVPGLKTYGTKIVIAGKGTNHTNLPREIPPPAALQEKNRLVSSAAAKANNQTDDKNKRDPNRSEKESGLNEDRNNIERNDRKPVVFIYHTHTEESFLPLLQGVHDPDAAWHETKNITLVGKKLGEALEARGIGTIVNRDNVTEIYQKRGWDYSDSYRVSREIVKKAMKQHDSLVFFFDIHQDSLGREATTVTINNKRYARTFFVVGTAFKGYQENLQLAKTLHHLLERHYPGLSRGVFAKDKTEGNGIYNQDLSDHALIIEVGGYGNTLDELYRSAEALAEVIHEYYRKNKEKLTN